MPPPTDSELVARNLAGCSWPDLYYYGVVSVLAQRTETRRVLEVGVAYGYHARSILEALPSVEYYGVGPYRGSYDSDDQFSEDVRKLFAEPTAQRGMDRLHTAVQEALAAAADLAAWWSKLRLGGYLLR